MNLFIGQLTSVIVEQMKTAKEWDKFVMVAEHSVLKKAVTAVSQAAKGRSSFRSFKGQESMGDHTCLTPRKGVTGMAL